MPIRFVDLARHHAKIRGEIRKAIEQVVDQSSFILGKGVENFEQHFATFCESKYCIGVASGTDALHLALKAMGVKAGEEVITAANTFMATALAVEHCGARIKLVDADEKTYNLNPEKLQEVITKKTKAIIPVHLFGQPAAMDAIMEIAEDHGIQVLEDACQAHGARYKGKRVGNFGRAAAFSFYPPKNIGAWGDGGAIVTNDASLQEMLRKMRNYGQKVKHCHEMLGFNSRLDTIQAVVLDVKLRNLETYNQLRRKHAERYRKMLDDTTVLLPEEAPSCEHVYHLFVIRSKQRDALAAYLKAENIETGIHYPTPIHLQPAFTHLGYSRGSFPVTEQLAAEMLSLPMFPELTEAEIQRVADAVRAFEQQQK